MALPKKRPPSGLLVTADGREINLGQIAQRMSQPGYGSTTGISATLPSQPSDTLPVVPDSLPPLPTAGAALMGANIGGPQPVSISLPVSTPTGQSSAFNQGMARNTSAVQGSRMSLAVAAEAGGAHPAPGALDPNSPYAGQSGMQGGALRVVADPEQLKPGTIGRELAEGFGPGNVVSAGGYQAMQQRMLDQRQANTTGKRVTTRGGSGGIPGGGGAAISTTTTPRYVDVESSVNGKTGKLPEPVANRFGQIMSEISKSAMASTNNASPTGSPDDRMAIAKARTDAREALSDEKKSFLAAVESGAGPEAFGLRVANEGGKTNTGKDVGRTYTTALPKATKPGSAGKMSGQLTHDFPKIDKSITSTSTSAMVDKHLARVLTQPEEIQKALAARNPNFGKYKAALSYMTHEEAKLLAYGVKPAGSGKPKLSDGSGIKMASLQVFGDPVTTKKKVYNEELDQYVWIEEPVPGQWKVKPWYLDKAGQDVRESDNPAAKKKAMRAAYDDFYKKASLYDRDDKSIAQLFSASLRKTITDDEELVVGEGNIDIWNEIKNDLGVPVRQGDKSAGKLEAKQARQDRPNASTDHEGVPMPAPAPKKPKVPGPADALNSVLEGTTKITTDNAKGLASTLLKAVAAAKQNGTLTPEQEAKIAKVHADLQRNMTVVEDTSLNFDYNKALEDDAAAQSPTTQPAAKEQTSTEASTDAVMTALDAVREMMLDPSALDEHVDSEIDIQAEVFAGNPDIERLFRLEAAKMREEQAKVTDKPLTQEKKAERAFIIRDEERKANAENLLGFIGEEIKRGIPMTDRDIENIARGVIDDAFIDDFKKQAIAIRDKLQAQRKKAR